MAWLIEAFNEETSIEESGTLHKAMIGLKMNWNNSREKIFKEDHGNKNMLAYVQKCNSIEDLEYLRKDAYVGIKDMQKTYENLKKVESGATPEKGSIVKGTYDFYQKEFIKKGITSKDVKLTIDFTKNQILPAISKRIKELKEQDKK